MASYESTVHGSRRNIADWVLWSIRLKLANFSPFAIVAVGSSQVSLFRYWEEFNRQLRMI
ncbi:hypothetical protein vseg_005094 [Gypsophila vaccaria]